MACSARGPVLQEPRPTSTAATSSLMAESGRKAGMPSAIAHQEGPLGAMQRLALERERQSPLAHEHAEA